MPQIISVEKYSTSVGYDSNDRSPLNIAQIVTGRDKKVAIPISTAPVNVIVKLLVRTASVSKIWNTIGITLRWTYQ